MRSATLCARIMTGSADHGALATVTALAKSSGLEDNSTRRSPSIANGRPSRALMYDESGPRSQFHSKSATAIATTATTAREIQAFFGIRMPSAFASRSAPLSGLGRLQVAGIERAHVLLEPRAPAVTRHGSNGL